jgi:hypothetical protein
MSTTITLSALLVAGGGGGAGGGSADSINAGGGGAGGVLYSTFNTGLGQTYNINVGNGGVGGTGGIGGSGGDSTISYSGDIVISNDGVTPLRAFGGGTGGGDFIINGSSGGSGGGGGASPITIGIGGQGTTIQGFSGGSGYSGSVNYGGGGGGAGHIGYDALSNNGGQGGFGIKNPIPGSTVGQLSAGNYWIAGGGGGGSSFAGAQISYGGAGGGGNGSPNSPTNGLSATGGGGGGAYSAAGGSGGSGVIVLVIPTAQYSGITTGSPSVTVVGTNTLLKYTNNGSYTSILQPLYTLIQNANAGTLFFNQGFDINKDIVVTFDYACYGNGINGSEGFSVFFTSTLSALSGGGPGPGLCYAPVQNVNSVTSQVLTSFGGVQNAALGIGFDMTGNFGTNFYGLDGSLTPIPNSISIRGSFDTKYSLLYNSGNLNSNAFPFPYLIYQQITIADTPIIYDRVRVRITDFGQRVAIDIKRSTDYTFSNFVNYVLPASTWWPDTVYCGLGFAGGQNITNFKIKDLNVNGVFLSSYRTWNYTLTGILGSSLFISPKTGTSTSVFLNVGDTIDVYRIASTPLTTITNNTQLYTLSTNQTLSRLTVPALINITSGGTAGLQSGDQYIIIQ